MGGGAWIFHGRRRCFLQASQLRYDCVGLCDELREVWVPLGEDDATRKFLSSCLSGPSLWDFCALAPLRMLRWCLSATDANAVLGRGEMFVLSSCQAW